MNLIETYTHLAIRLVAIPDIRSKIHSVLERYETSLVIPTRTFDIRRELPKIQCCRQ